VRAAAIVSKGGPGSPALRTLEFMKCKWAKLKYGNVALTSERKLLSAEKKGINEIAWECLVSVRWGTIPISKGRREKARKCEITLKLQTGSAKFQNQTQLCIRVFLWRTRQYEYKKPLV
jgi:hypothetical protein